MFSRLVASRPSPERERQGLVVSALLHGSMIAAAVLLTAQGPMKGPAIGSRAETIHFSSPAPEPPPAGAPAIEASAPTPTLPTVATIEVPLVGPIDVPAELPAPTDMPWTVSSSATLPRQGVGAPGGTGQGDPLAGHPGAYAADGVDVPVALDPRSPLPRYPEALRSWRTEGRARLLFVVDTSGRVELRTVRVVEASHPAFAASVRATLPRMRFRPARLGARAVRQLVEFPITFRFES